VDDLEPIPETARAIDELDLEDGALLEDLLRTGRRVRAVVPDCVGLSLTIIDYGVTLTLVASGLEVMVLDAVQYLAGGPCERAVDADEVIYTDASVLDENNWHLFADATAARGIASTLSLPVLEGDAVIGGVNLYGATAHAFEGHAAEVAEVLGAWAAGAVSNADLSFESRRNAQRAPDLLREAARVDAAVGMLAARLDIDVDEARDRLLGAAARAGLPPVQLVEVLMVLLDRHPH
jgi:GAF domain-containing protein